MRRTVLQTLVTELARTLRYVIADTGRTTRTIALLAAGTGLVLFLRTHGR